MKTIQLPEYILQSNCFPEHDTRHSQNITWTNLLETADLVTFTQEILNGKLHFLCSENSEIHFSNDFKGITTEVKYICINTKWALSACNRKCTFYSFMIISYSCETSIAVNMAIGEGNDWNGIWKLIKRWSWNSCTKLALSATKIHSLIAHSSKRQETRGFLTF